MDKGCTKIILVESENPDHSKDIECGCEGVIEVRGRVFCKGHLYEELSRLYDLEGSVGSFVNWFLTSKGYGPNNLLS
jgi:hypothetical protein